MENNIKKVPMSILAKVQSNANDLIEEVMAEGAKIEDIMEKMVNLAKKVENVDTAIKTIDIDKNVKSMSESVVSLNTFAKNVLDKFKGDVHHTLSKVQGEQVRLNDIVIANNTTLLDRIDSIYEELNTIKDLVTKK